MYPFGKAKNIAKIIVDEFVYLGGKTSCQKMIKGNSRSESERVENYTGIEHFYSTICFLGSLK